MDRNIALDILKLSMAFMVVGLHAGFLGDFTPLGQYLSVNGIFRIAVPVFLIINGFFFFSVVANGAQIYWLKRVSILYVIWMLFYSYFWFSTPELSLIGIAQLTQKIIIGYHHLWYLSGMVVAAIILLLLRHFSLSFLISSTLVSFFVGVVIQYLGNYHYFEGGTLDTLFNEHWFHRNALFFSYPFFCIGYLIHKHSIHEKFGLKYVGVISALGVLLLLGESYLNYYQAGRDGGFDNYLSLILVCPFIFLLFIKLNISGNSKNIALYSSAIYFIHSLLLSVLRRFTELEPTLLTVTVILTSIGASYVVIKVNKRVKIIL